MGNAASDYEKTNWAEADGGLTKADECVSDAMGPTDSMKTITLIKKGLKDRVYDIKDEEGTLLFTTGTPEGEKHIPLIENFVPAFVMKDKDGAKIFRVDAPSAQNQKEWIILAFDKPAYAGQEPDASFSEKAGSSVYRKARVLLEDHNVELNKNHATVSMYTGPKAEDTVNILSVDEVKKLPAAWQTKVSGGKDAGLVAHWKWQNTITVHKVELEMAKGVDPVLHMLLVVLTNLVRRQVVDEVLGGNISYDASKGK